MQVWTQNHIIEDNPYRLQGSVDSMMALILKRVDSACIKVHVYLLCTYLDIKNFWNDIQ